MINVMQLMKPEWENLLLDMSVQEVNRLYQLSVTPTGGYLGVPAVYVGLRVGMGVSQLYICSPQGYQAVGTACSLSVYNNFFLRNEETHWQCVSEL